MYTLLHMLLNNRCCKYVSTCVYGWVDVSCPLLSARLIVVTTENIFFLIRQIQLNFLLVSVLVLLQLKTLIDFLSSLENIAESNLSTSLENLVQAHGFVSTGRFTLPLSAIRKQHKRTR